MAKGTGKIRELGERVRSGQSTFAHIADEAIASRRADLGAYRHVDDDQVRVEAAAADTALGEGHDFGPLMGLPVSAKDLYGVPGYPIHAGSPKALPDEFARSGQVIEALRQQMMVITGKTHTVEFAFGGLGTNPHYDTPTNPWDSHEHRVPGGSSAGAGVSLCEGSAVLALGTDTAGSSRIPAAMTGKVGLKTSKGRWSTSGIVPLSTTLDTAGCLTNTVEDVITAFAAIDPTYSTVELLEAELGERPISAFELGRCDRLFWEDLSPGVGEAVEEAIAELAGAGARLSSVDIPEVEPTFELFKKGGPVSYELNDFLAERLPDWIETLDPNVKSRIEGALDLPESDYEDRLQQMKEWSASVDDRLTEVDVIVAPTVAITPPTMQEVATPEGYGPRNLMALRNTSMANYLGLCAITLPVGLDSAGMPVGLMFMARGGHDEHLLAVARAAEAVLGTGEQRLGTAPRLA